MITSRHEKGELGRLRKYKRGLIYCGLRIWKKGCRNENDSSQEKKSNGGGCRQGKTSIQEVTSNPIT